MEAAEFLPIEPSHRQPITGADDDEDALALPFGGHANRPAIPSDIGLAVHARKRRAPWKGHRDRQGKLDVAIRPVLAHAGVFRVEAEVPRAVEIHPLGPLEIGSRMLGQGDITGL